VIARLLGNPETGQPTFVFEDIHHTPRIPLFRFWGVSVEATPWTWINVTLVAIAALVATFIFYPTITLVERIAWTVLWTIVILAGLSVHSLGHIISGKIAGSAMDRLLITATRQVNIYECDQSQFPPRVHITRALGGGVTNLIVSLLCLILISVQGHSLHC